MLPVRGEAEAPNSVDPVARPGVVDVRRDGGDAVDAARPQLEHEGLEHGFVADVQHAVDDADIADGYEMHTAIIG